MEQERPRTITQEMIALYDEYTHLSLDRRAFMDAMIKLTGSSVAATAAVALIAADARAQSIVAADDERITAETVTWPGADGEMSGYLVKPAEVDTPLPGVIVIHENRGLNEHIRDVARRLALEGFVVLAPDFLSPLGGTPEDEDEAREMFADLDGDLVQQNGVATVDFLGAHPDANGNIGATGFCWGGGTVGAIAVASPDLTAAVAYYGAQPATADIPNIEARLMFHYGGLDERINAGIPEMEAALEAAGKDYQIFIYEGANHAFNNDTSPARYDAEAAALAWSRTVQFFSETLG